MSEQKKKLADELIEVVKGKINEIADVNEGWGKALNIAFKDIGVGYWLKFAMAGHVEKLEKRPISEISLKDAEATSTFSSVDVFKGMLEGEIQPLTALSMGQLVVDGKMDAMMKLANAM